MHRQERADHRTLCHSREEEQKDDGEAPPYACLERRARTCRAGGEALRLLERDRLVLAPDVASVEGPRPSASGGGGGSRVASCTSTSGVSWAGGGSCGGGRDSGGSELLRRAGCRRA